jgi:RNA polymerase sigma-70 factor (ECF subfamily)
VELADSVSTAMLLVLETLPPTERAVFVLREVFDVPYAEIAEAVEKSEPAVRQIATRARAHVAERRPRASVSTAERDAVIERFRAATETGDLQSLMDVLAPDVVLLTDGGGVKKAALRPILGRDKVVRFLDAVAPEGVEADVVVVNGAPALRLLINGEVDGIGTMLVENGLVTGLYIVRNPAKLARLDEVTALTR